MKVRSWDFFSKCFHRLSRLPSTERVCVRVDLRCQLPLLHLCCWDGSLTDPAAQIWLGRLASKAQWSFLLLPSARIQVYVPTQWVGVLLNTIYLIFLRKDLSLSLELGPVTSKSQWSSCLALAPHSWGYRCKQLCPAFYMGSGALNSSSFLFIQPVFFLALAYNSCLNSVNCYTFPLYLFLFPRWNKLFVFLNFINDFDKSGWFILKS